MSIVHVDTPAPEKPEESDIGKHVYSTCRYTST